MLARLRRAGIASLAIKGAGIYDLAGHFYIVLGFSWTLAIPDMPREPTPKVLPVWPASIQDLGCVEPTSPSSATSAFRLARVDELRHLVEQREMVPRLGRGCLDAPQVEVSTIYRLYCEKLEAPSAN